jgi:hypothetical protein
VAAGKRQRNRSSQSRIGSVLVAALVIGLLGAGVAWGATLTGPGMSATVTASVSPSSLPKRGSAPVSLSVKGTITADAAQAGPITALTIQLDRQLAVDGADLPTCKVSDLTGATVTAARQKCKAALVGSGTVTQRVFYPETPPVDVRGSVLFFNGGASRILTYTFLPEPLGPAGIVGAGPAKGGRLEATFPKGWGTTVAFAFRFGKAWRQDGQKVGYLSGRCATGGLRNRVTIDAVRGSTAPVALTQNCQGTA